QTLTFEPKNRHFPMSTEYTASIPAQTAAENGAHLKSGLSWKFRTGTVHMIGHYPPAGPVRPTTLMMVQFDQKINADAVLKAIHVSADGKAIKVIAVSENEKQSNKELAELLKHARAGTHVVFKPQAPLPLASSIAVRIGPGTPSAEGPLLNKNVEMFNFD